MTPDKKRRRLLWVLLSLPVIVFVVLVIAAMPGKNIYTVSPETTYATEAVGPDGFVDNITALNARLRAGITPERNANVHIWQAIGPHPERGTMPEEYFVWLGRPAPPEQGEYLLSWHRFLEAKFPPPANGAAPAGVNMDEQYKRRDRVQGWPWKAADEPDFAEWIARNARPLELFTQAGNQPDYFNPLVPKRTPDGQGMLISSLLPNVQVTREAGVLFVCRAMMRLGAGRADEAWKDLIACHRLGRVLEKGGTLIEFLVGVAIENVAMQGEIVFLSEAKLTAAQLKTCRTDLEKLPPHSPVADKADLTERFSMLDIIQWLARSGPGALKQLDVPGMAGIPEPAAGRLFSRSTDWNVAMRLANGWYDRMVAAMRIEDVQAREKALTELEQSLKALVAETKGLEWAVPLLGAKQRGEVFGKIIISLMLPAVHKISAAEARNIQQHRNLTLAFALAAYRFDHGKYPAKLDELTPKYLPELPRDIYADGPLGYRLTDKGYVFHSIGPNRADDQGRGRDDQPPGDDFAITLPAKEPPPIVKPMPVEAPMLGEQEPAPK